MSSLMTSVLVYSRKLDLWYHVFAETSSHVKIARIRLSCFFNAMSLAVEFALS